MPSVAMLNITYKPFMLSVIILNVIAPNKNFVTFTLGAEAEEHFTVVINAVN
jgi:hypothetical protein